MNADSNNPSKNQKKKSGDGLTRTEVILAVALILAISYLIYLSKTHDIVEPTECTTPGCYESIIEIQNFIDESVDPCENFHKFVCGNFFENAYKTQVTAKIIQEQRQYHNELEAMIVEPISEKDSKAIEIQKMFFQACVDVEKNDENHNKIILDLIDDIGGWPLRTEVNWTDKEFDWMQVMVKCKKLGLPFQWFLEFSVHGEDVNYLKVSYPVLDQAAKPKRTTMEQIIGSILGKKVNAKEIFEFDQRLVGIIKKQKAEMTLSTIGELQAQHPIFKWLNFINGITENSFDEDTQVASNVNDYIVNLYQLLKGTPKRTQANYIMWKIVEHFVPYLSSGVRKYGRQNTSHVHFCKENTKKNFEHFTEIEYLRKYANEEVQSFVTELTDLVRQETVKRVEESFWRNTSLGQKVVDIFNHDIEVDIGLDFANEDEEILDANYWHIGNMTFDSENPNIIEISMKRSKYLYESLFASINTTVRPEMKSFLLTMDTHIWFNSSSNRMVIPPSLMHGFLFENERPNYLNFASLGSLIAKEFIKITQLLSNRCLEVDYKNIVTEQTTFTSLDVISDVLPDIIARLITYDVYQNWVNTNGEETRLPLLSYSPNQLFWIKSSLINCHKKLTDVEDESDFNLMVSKYKNILAVRHSRHFADDFSCAENTTMNPITKC